MAGPLLRVKRQEETKASPVFCVMEDPMFSWNSQDVNEYSHGEEQASLME